MRMPRVCFEKVAFGVAVTDCRGLSVVKPPAPAGLRTEISSQRACPASGSEASEWLYALVRGFQSEPVANPPRSILRYSYLGRIVYYVPAPCCDQMSTLHDMNGRVICAPDGGFAGGGDGKCSDFFELRMDEVLIWSDTRK